MKLLTLASLVASLAALNRASPARASAFAALGPASRAPGLEENGDDKDEEELVGEPDFEDDDDDDSFLDFVDPKHGNVDSLMHVHQNGGEILVPCFGMWWPVGPGPPVYEYVEDYYGDYKKKRRSRKRKRAKAKRKKS